MTDFSLVEYQDLSLNPQDDTFKVIEGDKVKILNTQDGIEVIVDPKQKEVEAYMAL